VKNAGREMDKFSKLIAVYTTDLSLGDIDEVPDVCPFVPKTSATLFNYTSSGQDFLDSQHQLTFYGTSACMLNAEIDTITATLGG
jgi:formin-binding protein 1